METTETNTENPTPEAPPAETAADAAPEAQAAPDAPAEDPSIIGKISPEEQAAILQCRQQTQQLLAKIGEQEVLKLRLFARVEELDAQGQGYLDAITKRLNLPPGVNWVSTGDGNIRLAKQPPAGQNGQGGPATPPR